MPNGEAIYNHGTFSDFAVVDRNTGRETEEAVYVLRPTEDHYARTAMFVYAAICGLSREMQHIMAMPPNNAAWLARARTILLSNTFEEDQQGSEPISRDGFTDIAWQGAGADGTVEYAEAFMESLGYELVKCVYRSIPDEERAERIEKAKGILVNKRHQGEFHDIAKHSGTHGVPPEVVVGEPGEPVTLMYGHAHE